MKLTRRYFLKSSATAALFLAGCGGNSGSQSNIEEPDNSTDPNTNANAFALTDISGNQLLTFDGLILEVLRP